MSQNSKIEWTDNTWNFLAGCRKISPGCDGCYAIKDAWRMAHNPNPKMQAKFLPVVSDARGKPNWTGEITFSEEALLMPLRVKKPTRWFVNSLSDLFHENVKDEWIDKAFAVMALCPQHVFQILTKRPERMLEYLTEPFVMLRVVGQMVRCLSAIYGAKGITQWLRLVDEGSVKEVKGEEVFYLKTWPLPNVWLGVSVENQKYANERIPLLLQTPAAVRWLSIEPLLGPMDLTKVRHKLCDEDAPLKPVLGSIDEYNVLSGNRIRGRLGYNSNSIDWVVVGGESGPDARPMQPKWAQSLRDQCTKAHVPFFFKQWGAWSPSYPQGLNLSNRKEAYRDGQSFYNVGKKLAGRELDGRTWDEMPEVSC